MRTLPLLLEPAADETLFSFLRRLAAHSGSSLTSVMKPLGLCGDGVGTDLLPDAGVYLADRAIATIALATDLEPTRVRQLLLSTLLGSGDERPPPPDAGRLRWFRRRHLVATGSRCCPACVAGEGVFTRWWRLTFAFACPVHRVLLEEQCPACGRWHDYQPSGRPDLISLVPQLGRCSNRAAVKEGPTAACGRRFSQAELVPAVEHVVRAQVAVLEVVRTGRGLIAGKDMNAPAWLGELAGLVRTLRLYGSASVLSELAAAAETHPIPRGRMESFMGGPPSLAVLVPHAIDLMTKTDLEGLVRGMAPIADNAHERGCRSASQAAAVGLRGTTLHAWSLAVGHRGRFTSRLRSRSLPPMRNSEMSKLLPQVLWPEATDRFFADILDWVLPSHKCRFLSLALGVAATKASFADVSAQLQLPEDSWDARFYKAVTNGLRQRGEDDAAYRGVLACHEWLSDKQWTVNYTSRRAALPSFPVISPSEWRWACWSTGSHVGAGRRHRHAQIWLWLAITGNAYSLPGVTPGAELAAQRRFVAYDLPRLEPALLLLGARELWKHGLRGGVRGDLSGWEPTPEQPGRDFAAVGPIDGEPGHRPAAPSSRAASPDQPLGHDADIDRLCVLFSVIDLAKLLGLGPGTIRRARHGIRSPKGPRRRRISYLLDLVDTLAVTRNDHQVREWFRDEGHGSTPLGLLAANAWEPVDPVARLLLQRAQAETSGGAEVRRRLVIVTDCAERAFRLDRPRVVPADVLEVVSHLGVDHTAGVMDVLPVVVQRYRRGESYPNRLVLARFGQVRKILDAVGGSPDAAKSWFTAPNAALGRRSPSECLHGSWVPEGPVAVKVLQAARVAPRPPLARYDELADATRG